MKRFIWAAAVVSISYGFLIHDQGHTQAVAQEPQVVKEAMAKPPKKWKPSAAHIRAETYLAALIFGECRGCNMTGMYAVGHVALNRAAQHMDDRYGRGLWGVISKRKQFSCFNKNDPNRKVIEKAIAGKLDPDSVDGIKWTVAREVAHDLMHRDMRDPTGGAVFYHTSAIKPKWIKDRGMNRVAKIDGHIFYRKDA